MRKLLLCTLCATAFLACTDKAGTLRGRLDALDKEFSGADVTDKKKAEEFIVTAEQLAALIKEKDPDQYADLILKAAGLAKTIENPHKAVELYTQLAEGMPNHPKAPTALFMLGFVYENDLGDLAKARSVYESFLQKYPDDPGFADDAKFSLENLGVPPDSLAKKFEQMNKDSSARVGK
ncbi:MAG TPA: tetratricopeptide repeat protein [Saprospiraceae bacterium]|nr:tetratricopeptide repeat protein [Saprospiraceae bacterium]